LILNTHGHYDHRHGNAHYSGLYDIKIVGPKEDAPLYKPGPGSAEKNAELTFLSPELQAGTIPIKTFPTPGHTPGGVCLLIGEYLFSGDSLFEDSIGRIGAGDANGERQIREKMVGWLDDLLARLPAETSLLPGHGRATTLSRVKEINPYLKTGR
jgi:glyoxylase-like metal-dependent hydrolase (beta-lactamase superfamily II)